MVTKTLSPYVRALASHRATRPALAVASALVVGTLLATGTSGATGPNVPSGPAAGTVPPVTTAKLSTSGTSAHLHAAASVAPRAVSASGVPQFDHVLVVVMENHSATQIIGNSSAPYMNSLASQGANFTQSYAVTHPSQPNYLALFSGSTQGVTDDSCPHTYGTENLGHQLVASGRTFAGYSEDLPSQGSTVCTSGNYARKHVPWADFSNVATSANKTFAQFPSDYSTLPTVSFVIPNLCNDIHNCSVATGDAWLKSHLDGYVQWAKTHNSLFVLTFDEDDNTTTNRIPTVFVGQHVTPASYSEKITHYSVLRTLQSAYGLPGVANSASASAITDVWAP